MERTKTKPLNAMVKFIEHEIPPLRAGEHTLDFSQKVSLDDHIHHKKACFFVKGDRFKLNPMFEHSCYPPPNGSGRFEHVLPHIVFNKSTLPWEYRLERTATGNLTKAGHSTKIEAPWLALLVFHENELEEYSVTGTQEDKTGDVKKLVGERSLTARDCKAEKLIDDFKYGEQQDDPCQVIDIPGDLFHDIGPEKDELGWLAHIREVSVADKEDLIFALSDPAEAGKAGQSVPMTQEATRKKKFSVVVANRFPKREGISVVYLVSLQGKEKLIASKETNKETVSLIYLKKWTFYSEGSKGRVHSYLANIKVQPFRLDPNIIGSAVLQKYLADGYLPANHHTRDANDQTVSWYRGPFIPYPAKDRSYNIYQNIFRSPDEATYYDEGTGMFNIAYAAAWKLGQVLTLRNHKVTTAIYKMKSDFREKVKNDKDVQFLGNQLGLNLGGQNVQHESKKSLSLQKCRKVLEMAGGNDTPHVGQNEGQGSEAKNLSEGWLDWQNIALGKSGPEPTQPSEGTVERSDVTGLEAIRVTAEKYPLPKTVQKWFADLALLKGVPLAYLIPNQDYIPGGMNKLTGSLSFFYLDPAWISALLDGANSIGRVTQWDKLLDDAGKPTLQSATAKQAYEERNHQELTGFISRNELHKPEHGKTDGKKAGLNPPGEPIARSGILLRSGVVRDWPGLEVCGYADTFKNESAVKQHHKKEKLPILRMDRLTPDLLLCLFEGELKSVFIQEPTEGIHFGLDENNTIKLFNPISDENNSGTKKIDPLKLHDEILYRSPVKNNLVVNVQGLQKVIQDELIKHIIAEEWHWNPAEFGVQMVRRMHRVVFNTEKKQDGQR